MIIVFCHGIEHCPLGMPDHLSAFCLAVKEAQNLGVGAIFGDVIGFALNLRDWSDQSRKEASAALAFIC